MSTDVLWVNFHEIMYMIFSHYIDYIKLSNNYHMFQLVKDHETGTSRGFAFITFAEVDSGN